MYWSKQLLRYGILLLQLPYCTLTCMKCVRKSNGQAQSLISVILPFTGLKWWDNTWHRKDQSGMIILTFFSFIGNIWKTTQKNTMASLKLSSFPQDRIWLIQSYQFGIHENRLNEIVVLLMKIPNQTQFFLNRLGGSSIRILEKKWLLKHCYSQPSHKTLQWCHISIMTSQITGKSTVCSKACSDKQHEK